MNSTNSSPDSTIWDQSVRTAREKFADLDQERLKSHIQKNLGNRSQVEIVDLSALTEGSGMSNGIALFTLRQHEDGKIKDSRMVVRYNPGVSLLKQKSFSDEYNTIRAAAANGMPAPNAFWPDFDGSTLGCQGFIMDRVEAEAPASSMYTSGPLAHAHPQVRKEMMLQAASLQGRLRKAAIPAEKVPHLIARGVGRTAIERELSWWLKEAELNVTSDDPKLQTIREVYEWMVENQPNARPATLTHGDGQICNIMYRDNRAVCWLDWELAYLGHQESDLMMIIMTSEVSKPDGFEVEGIPSDSEYIRRYEQESGSRVEHWPYFKLLMVFKYLVGLTWVNLPHVEHIRHKIISYLDQTWAEARA